MESVTQWAEILQKLLTEVAEESAEASGYARRKPRAMDGAGFTQTMVTGFMRNPASTLDQLVQTTAAMGIKITRQGLDQRFTPESADTLLGVLEAAVQQVVSARTAVPVPLLERFRAVEVQDSSIVALPEPLEELYAGCGERTGKNRAALKVHLRLDLRSGTLRGPYLSSARVQDKSSPLRHVPLQKGSLRIADLGFFVLDEMAQLHDSGVWWLTRLKVGTEVFERSGQKLDLLGWLRQERRSVLDVPILLGTQHRLEARLLALRVPPQVASERRRRLRREARHKAQAVSQRRLALCDWTLLVTNAPPEKLSLQEAVALQRARWQIELIFRLWKSHGRIDEWRSSKPWRVLCELYAKLLVVLIEHWCCLISLWGFDDRSLVKAAQLIRDHALLFAAAVRGRITLQVVLEQIDSALQSGCRIDSRKKAPSSFQILRDPALSFSALPPPDDLSAPDAPAQRQDAA